MRETDPPVLILAPAGRDAVVASSILSEAGLRAEVCADLPGLVEVTLACLREAAETVDSAELARAKAQLKVALLSALETPGGRIERTARQLLAWGRVIPAAEVIAKVDAVTPDDVRAAGRALLAGAPTIAAIGPIKKLQSLEAVGRALRSG